MKLIFVKGYLPDDARALRTEIFVSEQGFEEEFDDKETLSTHIVAYDGDTPVGTCRYYSLPDDGEIFCIGRVAVSKTCRKGGVGSALVTAAESEIALSGGKQIRISAQVRAFAFYAKLGYVPYGETYFEEHVPHIAMKKEL